MGRNSPEIDGLIFSAKQLDNLSHDSVQLNIQDQLDVKSPETSNALRKCGVNPTEIQFVSKRKWMDINKQV